MNRQKRSSSNQHPPAMTMTTRSRGRARLTAATDNTPPVRTLAGGSQASQALTNDHQRDEEAGVCRAKRVKYDQGSSCSGSQDSSSVVSAGLFSEPGVVAVANATDAAANNDGPMSTGSSHRARTITVPRRGMRLNRLLSRVTSEVTAPTSDIESLPPPSTNSVESDITSSASFFDDPLLPMEETLDLACSDSDSSSVYATATSHDEFADLQPVYTNGAYESDDNSSDFSDDFYDLMHSDREITPSALIPTEPPSTIDQERSTVSDSGSSTMENSLESSEFDVFDSMMAHGVSDIPLVTEPEDEPQVKLKFRWLEDSQPSKETAARWPIEDDDSSTFSILVKKPASQPRPTNSWPPSNAAVTSSFAQNAPQNAAGTSDEPSIDEFFSEAATASFSDEEENVPSHGQSDLGKTATEWIEKYNRIPISGYRLRNITVQDPAGMAPAPATAAAPIKAYYRQAMLAASGLNRRALWSGKARQMVGGFTSYA